MPAKESLCTHIKFYGRINQIRFALGCVMGSSCECCPISQEPCDGLVVNVFPPIVLVAASGVILNFLMKYLPDTSEVFPGWLQFLIKIIVERLVGFCIQYLGCIRNMWKQPSCTGILATFFFLVFMPALLPAVLRVI